MGASCEICSHDNKFGANCNEDCSCLHGVCDNGVSGSGHCKDSCYEGYQGIDCQYQVQPCGEYTAQVYCHAHAQCEQEAGIIRCICIYGYEQEGQNCIAINHCSKPSTQCSSQVI
ncbi:stabilin-1-like [Anneissia japonica]|uniref:stabilin-1-like n=1 Tax=Anneissia japonica TaxID=1529436 RepID=UPI001425A632|nr:stabilin-1-like [Anneissia japonica]